MPVSRPASPHPMTTTCGRRPARRRGPRRPTRWRRCRHRRDGGPRGTSARPVGAPARRPRNAIISSDELGRRRGRQHAAAVAVGGDHRQGPPPGLGLVLSVMPALVVVEQASRAQVAADPRRVAGDVHQRAQQGRDADVLERGGDGGVVVGEREAGVRIAFRIRHSTRIRARPSVHPPRTIASGRRSTSPPRGRPTGAFSDECAEGVSGAFSVVVLGDGPECGTSSASSCRPERNSFAAVPMPRASSGSFFEPKRRSTTARTMRSSTGPTSISPQYPSVPPRNLLAAHRAPELPPHLAR